MNVRNASEADVDAIVAMSSKFYATTNYRNFASFCPDAVSKIVQTLINTGIMLIAECDGETVGMAGLYVAPFMFNADKKGAYEVVWWVEPDGRGKGAGKELLSAIDVSARAKDCHIIQMVTLATSPPHAGAIYESVGYSHSETSYTKEL